MNVNLKENRRLGASFFSLLSFWWLKDLFTIGTRQPITLNDMYDPLPEDRSKVLTNRLERNWQQELQRKSKKPSLIRAIFKTFRSEYAAAGLVTLFYDFVVRLLNPLFLHTLLRYFRHESEVQFNDAAYSAVAIVLLSVCGVFSFNRITYMGSYNGSKVRTAVCGLVYRKTLRLSKASDQDREMSPGHVTNLMSNDVSRFQMASVFVNWFWSAPLLTIAIGCILYYRVGWTPLIGVGVIVLVVPLQCYLGVLAARVQLRTTTQTDERLGLMAELISGIQMVKMYAWEKWMRSRILQVRDKELLMIRTSGFIRGVYMTMSIFVNRLMIFATLLAMVTVRDDQLTSANVFMVSAYYAVLGHALGQMFVRGATELSGTLVSIGRLERFLLTTESDAGRVHSIEKLDTTNTRVQIEAATAYWRRQVKLVDSKTMLLYRNQPPTLNSVSLKCGPDKLLVGIVGSVASGKTSLLELIMGELPVEACGRVSVNGRISYSPQEPWIFNGSIKENIVYDEQWDESRYQQVLDKCALLDDIKQLPAGDETLTGERGSSLSGGQKARVNLARAVYRRADIYLLDDPLSAVDMQVGRYLFDDVIGPNGILRNSTRLLVTHRMEYLEHMDWIVVLNEGSVEVQGTPSEILGGQGDLAMYKLDVEKERKDSGVSDGDAAKRFDMVPNNLENVVVSTESSVVSYLQYRGKCHWLILISALFALTQLACSGTDAFVAYWVRAEKDRRLGQVFENSTAGQNSGAFADEKESGIVDSKTLSLTGGALVISILLVGIVRACVFQLNSTRTSGAVHQDMLDGILEAPLSFYETNTSGRILNKFSRDLGVMDVLLPQKMLDAYQIVLVIIGTTVVVLIVNPVFILPLLVLGYSFRIVRKVYLQTSTQISQLDAITRSPIFTLVGSTLQGLSVIRSTKAQAHMTRQFDALQDLNTACWFLFQSTTTAFCQVLDMLGVIFITLLLVYFLCCDTVLPEEAIGLTLTQALFMIRILSWMVRHTAAVSNSFVSVERVMEYVCLPREEQSMGECPSDWPPEGRVEFVDLHYGYGNQAVLHGVSLLIKAHQKVGVVGRTGAGKSSLISAIFRLATVTRGSILIDGVDTRDIPSEVLRSRISIIPQDPVLFRGSIRSNLDPFDEYTDEQIRTALEDVDLAHLTANHPVLESGNNFSVGQKQLLCLARALLRRNKILILDEATANVDPITDELIQKTIRTRFRDCTVIAIAHRMNTVADADMVVVIDHGRISDYGPPSVILPKIKCSPISSM